VDKVSPARDSTIASDSPDRVRQIVRDDQRSARIDCDAYRSPAGFTIVAAKARRKVDGFAGRTAVAERDENHLVADGIGTIPAAVLADERAVGEFFSHRRLGKTQTERSDMRSQAVIRLDGGRHFLGILRFDAGI